MTDTTFTQLASHVIKTEAHEEYANTIFERVTADACDIIRRGWVPRHTLHLFKNRCAIIGMDWQEVLDMTEEAFFSEAQ
jgi:hypothetical protein